MSQTPALKFSVTDAQTKAFANAWDSGGIKLIMDNTSIRFATAWANIVLKSALEDPTVRMQIFGEVVASIKAAKAKVGATAPAAEPNLVAPSAPVPQKSSIILTN